MNVFPLKEKMVKQTVYSTSLTNILVFQNIYLRHLSPSCTNNPLLAWMCYLLKLMSLWTTLRQTNTSSSRETSRPLHFPINQTPPSDITCRPSWPSPAGIFQYSRCQTAQSKCSSETSWSLTQNGWKWPSVWAGLPFAWGNHFWQKKHAGKEIL